MFSTLLLFRRSLKGRLVFILLIAVIIPIILTGYISYRWIYVVQTKIIDKEFMNNVLELKNELERKVDEMNRVSQLLAVEGGIGKDVIQYLTIDDPYEKSVLYEDIIKSMTNVNFSNPNSGAMFFYNSDLPIPFLFPNVNIREDIKIEYFPLFSHHEAFTYHGPHSSIDKFSHGKVFSLLRKMQYGDGKTLFAYIEMKMIGYDSLFNPDPKIVSPYQGFHVLVNESNQNVFSNMKEINPIGQTFELPSKGYKVFLAEGQQGWKLYHFIPLNEYNREINKWKIQFFFFASLSLIFGALLSWLVWRTVYRPIRQINSEITRFSYDQSYTPASGTSLVEFNHVLTNFHKMRIRISELITDIEDKEKLRRQLEVEKLLVQINPHFLHNTLNTIQWLARIQGQTNIAELVSVLTRVLHYNLGKKNIIVTVREEVDAIKDYIELQNIRYDYLFKVFLDVEAETLEIPIPRFIIQPLVENALYHGFEEGEGEIRVSIQLVYGNKLLLQVRDNGTGISEEKLADLFLEEDRAKKIGLGIGLRYVKKMLDVYYGGKAKLQLNSKVGKGTTISIRLPVRIEEEDLR
jgi:two-component system sensor histidine kinase YesM